MFAEYINNLVKASLNAREREERERETQLSGLFNIATTYILHF